jgi:outer membrane protein TolC
VLCFSKIAFAEDLNLQQLIDEALKNNHEILAAEAKTNASKFRIPQAKSLPDPMLMIGYQNEGTRNLYTFGDDMAPDSQWMFTVSQMLPYPGKLSLKGEMALQEAESLRSDYDSVKLKITARIKELYYDLYFVYKNIELLKETAALFTRLEEAAISRYTSGMAPVGEILMAQTEKYMLLEREEMLRQKIQSIEAMLNAAIGRDVASPLGKPADKPFTSFSYDMAELIRISLENSPEIKAREKMVMSADARLRMAKREYYPDFTVSASYFARSSQFPDMWNLSTSINIPIFYKTKQKQAVHEAESSLSEARHELEAAKLMLSSAIRDNYSMLKTSETLMDLYKNALIPKTYQDFETSLAAYVTGRSEAISVITRLRSLIELETSYRAQFVEREKAIARIMAITGVKTQEPETGGHELKDRKEGG